MPIDKSLLEIAIKEKEKRERVAWADDFETVEAMLKHGIDWRSIAKLLAAKYSIKLSAASVAMIYKRNFLDKRIQLKSSRAKGSAQTAKIDIFGTEASK